MSDVAALAGVSYQTVSRVINDHPSVLPATRQRVLDAIAQQGYRRNQAARTLVTRRTGTIGVVASGSALFGPTSTLFAVERAARDAGQFVSVATLPQWGAHEVAEALEHFLTEGVDAVAVIAANDEAVETVCAFGSPVPVVMVGPAGMPAPIRSVAVDQYAGARQAVRHLLDLGHRQVTHLAGTSDGFDARRRIAGWRDELMAAGINSGDPIPGDWSAACGYAVGRDLVGDDLPTAVFAANDHTALGLLHAFVECGVRVPGDVSVVGFDDVEGSAHFFPPLTTVRQDFVALGERCMAVLLAAIAGESDNASGLIPTNIVLRESTGPARRI